MNEKICLENFQRWARNTEDPSKEIYLIKLNELEKIPDGTTLTDANGKTYVKGRDYIDLDTRRGFIAFGLRRDQIDPLCLVEAKLDGKI